MTNNPILEQALKFARMGLFVHPCREIDGKPYIDGKGETKTPLVKSPYSKDWDEKSTTDETQIIEWWTRKPNALIGIDCKKSNLFVIDIDNHPEKGKNGFDTFSKLGINDSGAWHSKTASGGNHIVFSGVGFTSTSTFGIDTRGQSEDGKSSYFIAPPSVIPGVGEYVFLDEWVEKPAPVTPEILEILSELRKKDKKVNKGLGTGKKNLSRSTLEFIANGSDPSTRNNRLYNAACDMKGCGYTFEEAKDRLLPIWLKLGKSEGEADSTIESAYSEEREPASKIDYDEKDNPEVAEALIGSVLRDENIFSALRDYLEPEDFYYDAHRYAWYAFKSLLEKGVIIDFITFESELKYTNHLQDFESKVTGKKGTEAILDLINGEKINTEHALSYAKLIKHASASRKSILLLENTASALRSHKITYDRAIEIVFSESEKISSQYGLKTRATISAKEAVAQSRKQIEMVKSGQFKYYPSGLVDLDKYIYGFVGGRLYIVAARPGKGKTTLATTIAYNDGIVLNKHVVFFTLEMSVVEIVNKLASSITGIPSDRIMFGKFNTGEEDKCEEAFKIIENSRIHFNDSRGLTIPKLRSEVRALKEADKVNIVILDQLNFMDAQIVGNVSKSDKLDWIAHRLKDITSDYDVPVILAHQMNRSGEASKDKTGLMKDNRSQQKETNNLSALEQAGEKPADAVIFIEHKEFFNEQTKKMEILESWLNLVKYRHGASGIIPVKFNGQFSRFEDFQNANIKDILNYREANKDQFQFSEDELPDWAREDA